MHFFNLIAKQSVLIRFLIIEIIGRDKKCNFCFIPENRGFLIIIALKELERTSRLIEPGEIVAMTKVKTN